MTYTHQYCNIDLTQVQQSSTLNSPVRSDLKHNCYFEDCCLCLSVQAVLLHELELELNASAMPILLHSATRRNATDPSLPQEQRDEFDDIIRIFVNNARILVRNASNAWEGH